MQTETQLVEPSIPSTNESVELSTESTPAVNESPLVVGEVAVTDLPIASDETLSAESISDLIRRISLAEDQLAQCRNQLRRRASTEPLTAAIASEIAKLAMEGDHRSRVTRKRYRMLEGTLSHCHPPFDLTKGIDWRRAADAALKMALSQPDNRTPLSLEEAIKMLTLDELESYCQLRGRVAKRAYAKDVKRMPWIETGESDLD